MATRDPRSNKLRGPISKRAQSLNRKTEKWVKFDTSTGKIVSHKKTAGPYKSITKK